MRRRPILLVLGSLALLAGLALVVVQLRTPAASVEVVAKADRQDVLVMARPVGKRALLRPGDLGWKAIAIADVPAGAYARGTATEAEFAGAVVRDDLQAGAILTAEQVVKVGERGFLAAVLSEGMRATSIAVGLAEGASGLIVPGDHVDVVLIQNFTEAGVDLSRRSVGETVLSNLRVIAIDQTMTTDVKAKTGDLAASAVLEPPRVAKTVTLEVTARQAEVLMVAVQLGKIQLTLRDADEQNGPSTRQTVIPLPTWGSDVSPALSGLGGGDVPGSGPVTVVPGPPTVSLSPPPSSVAVDVYHGPRTEIRCFDDRGQSASDCGTPSPTQAIPPAPTTAPGTSVPGTVAVPPLVVPQ